MLLWMGGGAITAATVPLLAVAVRGAMPIEVQERLWMWQIPLLAVGVGLLVVHVAVGQSAWLVKVLTAVPAVATLAVLAMIVRGLPRR
ncbi:hypothetical protein ACWDUL_20900 [Nocardia niigatensis]